MCIGGLDVGQNLLLQLVKPHMKKKKKHHPSFSETLLRPEHLILGKKAGSHLI